jgi:hypothetical protein
MTHRTPNALQQTASPSLSLGSRRLHANPVNLVHPELRQHVERVCSLDVGMTEEHQFVTALFDAYGFFCLTRGEASEPAQESLRHITSLELRPAVRRWYQNGPTELNPTAVEFCRRLSELVGEPL